MKTQIVVQFGDEDAASGVDAYLSAEVDSRKTEDGGLNNGETQFQVGDEVAILVYKSDNVVSFDVRASAGSVADSGVKTNVLKEEDVVFVESTSASLRSPASNGFSYAWMGNDLGPIALQADKSTVRIGSKGLGVARVSYVTPASVVRLQSPSEMPGFDEFTIVVLITGHLS